MTRLAVFDCDGTLVDSQANILLAMMDVFDAAGLPRPAAHDIRRGVGLSLIEIMRVLVPAGDDGLHARLAADYRQAFQQRRADKRLDPEPLYTRASPRGWRRCRRRAGGSASRPASRTAACT